MVVAASSEAAARALVPVLVLAMSSAEVALAPPLARAALVLALGQEEVSEVLSVVEAAI